jgi:hypothetical protein
MRPNNADETDPIPSSPRASVKQITTADNWHLGTMGIYISTGDGGGGATAITTHRM